MTTPDFLDEPPDGETVTPYDEQHFVTYLRLLDATAEGAKWQEIAGIIFGLDAETVPKRARLVHRTHLARARWLAKTGYRQLLARK